MVFMTEFQDSDRKVQTLHSKNKLSHYLHIILFPCGQMLPAQSFTCRKKLLLLLQQDVVSNICQAADRHLVQLVEWAKHIPHFTDLPIEDQVVLLKAGGSLVIIPMHYSSACLPYNLLPLLLLLLLLHIISTTKSANCSCFVMGYVSVKKTMLIPVGSSHPL